MLFHDRSGHHYCAVVRKWALPRNGLIEPSNCAFNTQGDEQNLQPYAICYVDMEQYLALQHGAASRNERTTKNVKLVEIS